MDELEPVAYPTSEATWCEWPKNPLETYMARTSGHYERRTGNNMPACFSSHPDDVIWNSAEWWCTKCDAKVYTNWSVSCAMYSEALHVVAPDEWYASETAGVRLAAASNSWFNRLHKRDPFKEGKPTVSPYWQARRPAWFRELIGM